MRFVKIAEIRGHKVYVEEGCPMLHSIAKDIKDGIGALDREKAKASVPGQFRPKGESFESLFGNLLRKQK